MDVLKRVFSIDLLIYIAIALITVTAMIRCLIPLSRSSAKLRRAAKVIITENKQKKEVRSWHDLGFLGERLQNTWADFLQNAEMRGAHGETCDVSEYINEETVIDTAGGAGLAEITPGLLTSLGILGTFLGLVKGLSGLSISAAHTEQLLAAMEQLIGGMSTAFLTSIAGVTCSVLFTLLNNHHLEKCRSAIDRFCDVFSLYAMPKPVSQETEMLALTREQTGYLRQAANEIGEKLSSQMEESIMRAMLPVQRSMDNFILAATKAQVEGMDRITQVFVQRMNVALGNEFDHLRQVLQETGREQGNVQQQMRATNESIAKMSQDVINMHQMSQGLLEHFKGYVDDMNQDRSGSEQMLARMTAVMEQMNRMQEAESAVIAQLQSSQAELSHNQQQYIATTERFLSAAESRERAIGEEMNRVGETFSKNAEEMRTAVGELNHETVESLKKTTALMGENITSSIERMDGTLKNMREIAETMPQLMSQSQDRYQEQMDDFVEALSKLEKSIQALTAAK